MELHKDPSLVLYSSSYTPLRSVLSYLIRQQTITSMLMILNFSYNFPLWISLIASNHVENTKTNVCNWMSSNFLSLNPSKTEFLIIGLPQQLSTLNNHSIHLPNNVILSLVNSARNLGVIFDKKYAIAQHTSAVSKSCFHNRRDLRRIRIIIDINTACTIATSVIHSKIDYCNSFLLNMNESSLTCPELCCSCWHKKS